MPFFLFTFLKFCALLNILLKRHQNKSRIRRTYAAFKENFLTYSAPTSNSTSVSLPLPKSIVAL